MSSTAATSTPPPRRPPRSRVLALATAGVGTIAAAYLVAYIMAFSAYPADDAFIHMRIARNLVQSGTPHYNPGEPVAASSSPLWLVLTSVLFAVGGPHPELVAVLTALITVGLLVVCACRLRRQLGPFGGTLGAAVLVAAAGVNTAALLMETPFALLLWMLAFVALERRRAFAAGLSSGLACCVRYEFILWLAVASLSVPGAAARRRFLLGACGPLAGLAIFNRSLFGSFLPNTVRAKSIIYCLGIGDSAMTAGWVLPPWSLLVLLAFHLIPIVLLWHDPRRRDVAAAMSFGAGLLALYLAQRVLIFPWYIPIYTLPLLASYGLALTGGNRRLRCVVALLATFMAVGPLTYAGREAFGLVTGRPSLYRDYWTGLRVRRYLEIGANLAQRYPGTTLMTSEVGALGWEFGGRIIDAAGVTSPECLRYHPLRIPEDRETGILGAIPPQAVLDMRPDLLVSMDIFSKGVRRELDSGGIVGYRLLAEYPVTSMGPEGHSPDNLVLWGARRTQVFVRTDSPPPARGSGLWPSQGKETASW